MKAYSVDYIKKTITLTKAFADKVNDFDSDEYKVLIKLQNDFPTFTIKGRTHATPKKYHNADGSTTKRNQFYNLTFENMEAFIKALPKAEELMKKYNFLKNSAYFSKHSKYSIVRKWFVAQFPLYRSNPLFYYTEEYNIIDIKDIIKDTNNTKSSAETTADAPVEEAVGE